MADHDAPDAWTHAHGLAERPEPTPERPPTFWERWGELLIAAVLLLLGVVVLVGAQDIRVSRAMAQVSPRVVPQLIGSGLLIVGVWYVVEIVRSPYLGPGEGSEDIDPDAGTDWVVLAVIGIGLAAYALLMEPLGFVLATAILFFIAAVGMGSRHVPRDAAIAVALGVAIFLVFDTWLGVRLPAGVFEELLSR